MSGRISLSRKAIHPTGKQVKHDLPVPRRSKAKSRRTFCGLTRSETFKILGSFLVPLVIGIFTIVTTIQQYHFNRQNRLKDLEIATRQRDQERKQADILHQETVYAVCIKEMGELSLKLKTYNLSKAEVDQQLQVARAKTLSVLRQLDRKRKGYLIQFLFGAELLFTGRPAIDLGGADLSEIMLTGHIGMELSFNSIALTHVILTHSSFVSLHIMNASFSGSQLDNSNFSNAYLYETNFTGCELKNADLRGVHAQYAIMNNVNLEGAIFGTVLPVEIKNAILPNGSYVFYSNDSLRSDLFNQSVNLIVNGDITCQTNINSTKIFGWKNPSQLIGSVIEYSHLPSSTRSIIRDDCLIWGGIYNSSMDYLHQRVFFYDYSRLIDSDRASYEFSFDSGGINGYNDSILMTIQFRAHNSQVLERRSFPLMTNIERKNRTLLCHHVQYGSVPTATRSLLVNIYFLKSSNSQYNNGLIDNIKFYMKQIKERHQHPEAAYNYTCSCSNCF